MTLTKTIWVVEEQHKGFFLWKTVETTEWNSYDKAQAYIMNKTRELAINNLDACQIQFKVYEEEVENDIS